MAEFAYNNKVYIGTKVLPFEANSGQNPRMGFEMRKKGRYEGAEKFMEKMKEIQGEAKAALAKVQCHEPPLWLSPFLLFFSLLFSFLFIAWESLSHYVTQGVTTLHQTVTSRSQSQVMSHVTRSHDSAGK